MIRIITSLLIASQMMLVVACGPKGGQAPNLTPSQAEVTYKVYREEENKRTELQLKDDAFHCKKGDEIVIAIQNPEKYIAMTVRKALKLTDLVSPFLGLQIPREQEEVQEKAKTQHHYLGKIPEHAFTVTEGSDIFFMLVSVTTQPVLNQFKKIGPLIWNSVNMASLKFTVELTLPHF